MKPHHVKNSDFMSILYSKQLREYKKAKFGIGERFRISKYDLVFGKGYKPQLTEENSRMLPLLQKKPPTYKINDEQEEVIREKKTKKK